MLNQDTSPLPAERLPCGCYGRCRCYAVGYIGLAAGVFLGALMAACLALAFGRELVPNPAIVCALGLVGIEFFGCVVATAAAIFAGGFQAAGSVWMTAKFYAGLAAGSVTALGATSLAVMLWSVN